LGGSVLGAAKMAVDQSVNYSNERKQFGRSISTFGAIKYKLAEQAIRIFANESAVYRTSRNVDEFIEAHADTLTKEKAIVKAFEEYAIEAAILKVYGSEMLDYVVDEGVQIHGGMGYSAEMPIERGYRDSRINRIFEGTNEINRIWAGDNAVKKGMKGADGLRKFVAEALESLTSLPEKVEFAEEYYEYYKDVITRFKKAIHMVIGAANEKYSRKLSNEQEIIFNIADMLIEVYAVESTALRVEKLESINGEAAVALYKDILDVYTYDIASNIAKYAKDALYSFVEGEEIEKYLKGVQYFTCVKGVNVKDARRRLADKIIDDNLYKF